MATKTQTLTNCYELDGVIIPTSDLQWSELTAWSDYTQNWGETGLYVGDNPVGQFNDAVVQIDDDMDTIQFRRPTCRFSSNGDVAVTLKISETGTFTGEETTVNLTLNTPVSFVRGRYYRWTFTVTDNSSTTDPATISGISTGYDPNLEEELFNDLDLASLTQNSEGDYEVALNAIGTVVNVQGTSVQGEPYVTEGYIALENGEKYILDQVGGAVVVESKNPLTVTVVDHTGARWDGTVDLVVRGARNITLTTTGVF